jgi:DNA-directed RNA polymerase subunit beta
MQRQSLSLIKKEMPFIETGIECSVVRESETTTIALKSGLVVFSNMNKIVVKEAIKYTNFFNENLFFNKFNIYNLFAKDIIFKNVENFTTTYTLGTSKKSNHSIFLSKNPIVKKGDWVKKGQVIADNRGSLNGNFSFGKNILIGYLGWEGYNFEDAIIISQRLLEEDVFTSLHVKKYKTFFFLGGNIEVRILIININDLFPKIKILFGN